MVDEAGMAAATWLSRDTPNFSAVATRLEQRTEGDKALVQRHRKLRDVLQ